MARAAVENACWDMTARAGNKPLYKLLDGTLKEIPCGVSIGIQNSPEQLLEKIKTEVNAGYRRVKLKIKPEWDYDKRGINLNCTRERMGYAFRD